MSGERVAKHVGFLMSAGQRRRRICASHHKLRKPDPSVSATRDSDYAGNSSVDLAVGKGRRSNRGQRGRQPWPRQAARIAKVDHIFLEASPLLAVAQGGAAHQWLKNLIVSCRIITSHNEFLADGRRAGPHALCLCARSAGYVLNDLMDLMRTAILPQPPPPVRSGNLPLSLGLLLVPLLLARAPSWPGR